LHLVLSLVPFIRHYHWFTKIKMGQTDGYHEEKKLSYSIVRLLTCSWRQTQRERERPRDRVSRRIRRDQKDKWPTRRTRLVAVGLVDVCISGRRLGDGEQKSTESLLTSFVESCGDGSDAEGEQRQCADEQRRLMVISCVIIRRPRCWRRFHCCTNQRHWWTNRTECNYGQMMLYQLILINYYNVCILSTLWWIKLIKDIFNNLVRDWRSTPLVWLSSTRDLDLDLGLGHTAYRRASVIQLYLQIKFL